MTRGLAPLLMGSSEAATAWKCLNLQCRRHAKRLRSATVPRHPFARQVGNSKGAKLGLELLSKSERNPKVDLLCQRRQP